MLRVDSKQNCPVSEKIGGPLFVDSIVPELQSREGRSPVHHDERASAAAVPGLRIMETDIDRIPCDHKLFTHLPEFLDGHLVMPNHPGWGSEPIEEAFRAHPQEGATGLLNYGRKV